LFRFLKFIEALEAADQDLEPAPARSQNAVRLMSIHQSKGLEFPVVAVACLGGMFNFKDSYQDVVLDDEFGLCAKVVQAGAGTRHPTLAHWLAARRQRRQVLGEELRLLYVAATRARDRLLLTATATKKDCESWEAIAPRAFGNREILSVRSPLDWLMLWLPTVTRVEDWREGGGGNALLQWKICADAADFELADEELAAEIGVASVTSEDAGVETAVATVTERIRWRYAHDAAVREPAKTSVTVLRRKADELADEEARAWRPVQSGRARGRRVSSGPDAAEVGSWHHEFLQRMILTGACDEADLRGQLAVMVEQGTFNAEQAAVLDLGALSRFWLGEIGSEIRRKIAEVRREVPFTARFTPVELEQITGAPTVPELQDEFVVVQGVADLVVMGESEIWLLDFKTDAVRKGELVTKVEHYRPQLQLYAAALAAIYGRPVTRRWLHFLKCGETVSL